MNGRIAVDGLEVECIIGVHNHERTAAQTIVIDVEVDVDFTQASSEDHIGATADYAAIAELVSQIATSGQYYLVEKLAEECAAQIIDRFHVERALVRVRKPMALPQARYAGVTVERHRPPDDHHSPTTQPATAATFQIRDRVIVVTGGSGGLGRSLARQLAQQGAQVILLARGAEQLETSVREIKHEIPDAWIDTRICNLTSADEVREVVNSIVADHGRIDVLVNFAGYGMDFGRIFPARPSPDLITDAENVVDCDLMGTLRAVLAVEPVMRRQAEGVIVTLGTTPTMDTDPEHLIYQVARAGLRQLTGALAAQHAVDGQTGIRIYWLALGNIYTPATSEAFNDQQHADADRDGWLHPDQHLTPIVTALISGELARNSGQTLRIDHSTAPALFAEINRPYEVFVPAPDAQPLQLAHGKPSSL